MRTRDFDHVHHFSFSSCHKCLSVLVTLEVSERTTKELQVLAEARIPGIHSYKNSLKVG